MLEAAERGIYADIQWLYRFIEKRDATVRALVQRRKSAIEKLDWSIKIKAGADEKIAKAQAKVLRDAYDRVDNLRDAIGFTASAEFRGFAHLEKHYNADGEVFHFEPVPQYYWARRMPRADWLYNKRAQSTDNGYQIDPRNFIVRTVEAPINEVAIVCYLRKNMSQKDWDAYIETYGLPPLFIEMPENAPIGLRDEYQNVINQVIGDMRGVLPAGARIQTVGPNGGGFSPFSEHISYQDSQIVMAGTGGKLTMLNDPTGLGSGQSEVHAATFDEIAKAEAKQINEVFQKQFDAQVLRRAFPNTEHVAYWALDAEDKTDVDKLVLHATQLSSSGWQMDTHELSEKTGYRLKRADDGQQGDQGEVKEDDGSEAEQEVSSDDENSEDYDAESPEAVKFKNRLDCASMFNRKGPIQANAKRDVAKAFVADMAPVGSKLVDILLLDDEDAFMDGLSDFESSLPQLLKKMNQSPESASALQRSMMAGFHDGMGSPA